MGGRSDKQGGINDGRRHSGRALAPRSARRSAASGRRGSRARAPDGRPSGRAAASVARSEETPLVTLEEEIEILEKYLAIQRVRFRDRLDVTIAVEPAVASAKVPTFLLQPLVENAIKHGRADGSGGAASRSRRATRAGGWRSRSATTGPGRSTEPGPTRRPASACATLAADWRPSTPTLTSSSSSPPRAEAPKSASASRCRAGSSSASRRRPSVRPRRPCRRPPRVGPPHRARQLAREGSADRKWASSIG